jgi:hypothetical protein
VSFVEKTLSCSLAYLSGAALERAVDNEVEKELAIAIKLFKNKQLLKQFKTKDAVPSFAGY